jgi:hypothetical protein
MADSKRQSRVARTLSLVTAPVALTFAVLAATSPPRHLARQKRRKRLPRQG